MIGPLVSVAILVLGGFSRHQGPADPGIIYPDSSVPVFDNGRTAHTNYVFWVGTPQQHHDSPDLISPEPFGPQRTVTPSGYYPADIRAAYHLPSLAGAKAIAIVDAYHTPTALNDFNVFSKQFGLPVETSTTATATKNNVFQVVNPTNAKLTTNTSWGQEATLDIEWAHAIAPNAKIYLVEAATNSTDDLYAAVKLAAGLPGVAEVSMSWGSPEFPTEYAYDSTFVQKGVVFIASSGDTGAPEYPAAGVNVVGVGGTSLTMSKGAFVSETPWGSSGGGPSAYTKLPAFQSAFSSIFKYRGGPDISCVADPKTAVAVYFSGSSSGPGWTTLGGTSVSCQIFAGMVNAAASWQTSSAAELTKIYAGLGGADFRSIKITASNLLWRDPGHPTVTKGWNYITGVGTPLGLHGL